MAGFREAFQLGQSIADTGIEAYDRARVWRDRLAERETEKEARAANAALDRDERNQKLYFEREDLGLKRKRALSEEKTAAGLTAERAAMTDLYKAQAESIRKGTGRYGTGGVKTGRDYSTVDRGNMIRSLSALKAYDALSDEQNTLLDQLIIDQAQAVNAGAGGGKGPNIGARAVGLPMTGKSALLDRYGVPR